MTEPQVEMGKNAVGDLKDTINLLGDCSSFTHSQACAQAVLYVVALNADCSCLSGSPRHPGVLGVALPLCAHFWLTP